MRVAWTEYADSSGPSWFGRIGPCTIALRTLGWHDPAAIDHSDAIVDGRAWVFTIFQQLGSDTKPEIIKSAVFDVVRVRHDGGLKEAQEHVVEIARKLGPCKRTRRTHEAIDAEAVAWLEAHLLDTLRTSYANWHGSIERLRQSAAAGDRLSQQVLANGTKSIYPEPRWTTARLAQEMAQYSLPDELDALTDKRFYALVYAALERLKRHDVIASSTGTDDQGREARLWEPL